MRPALKGTKAIRDALNALHAYVEMRPKCKTMLQVVSVESEVRERAEALGLVVYEEMVKGLARPQPCPMCGTAPRGAKGHR